MVRKQYNFYFLDRDGVINRNTFVNAPADFEFLPRSLDALQLLNTKGKRVFIATNQGGIEAGHLTEETLHVIHEQMIDQIEAAGGHIEKIYYCPSTDAACDWRKPNPGMLLKGLSEYNLNAELDECCFIGDWQTDWEAAIAAGIEPMAVRSGRSWGPEQVAFIRNHQMAFYQDLYAAVMATV